MPPDYSIVDIWPAEWRRLFSPIGAVWLAILSREWQLRDPDGVLATAPRFEWFAVVAVLLLLAWAMVGLVALCAAWAVEWLWLSHWPRLGRPLIRRRRRRWLALHRAMDEAIAASDGATAQRRARQRNAIAIAEPQCPHWMADRWTSLGTRVLGTYGLDVASTWPRLWLTLPQLVQAELRLAAAQWHRSCVWASWSVLYAGLALIWWPALVVAVLLAGLAWARGRWSIGYRADLVEATFDTYGQRLAEAMGVNLTTSGRLNPAAGHEITARIRKGA